MFFTSKLKFYNLFFSSSEYETPTGRTNNGVATKWLQPMIPDENANEKTEEPETEENVEEDTVSTLRLNREVGST